MEKEFVPYELAVKMKELGFDEPCFARFRKCQFQLNTLGKAIEHNSQQIVSGDVSAPLWQQAFDWFMNKHNAFVCWNWHTKGKLIGNDFVFDEDETSRKELINWSFLIDYYGSDFQMELTEDSDCGAFGLESYEQARHACLEKLIQLIQNKNDRSI